jgi:hypothetical protein
MTDNKINLRDLYCQFQKCKQSEITLKHFSGLCLKKSNTELIREISQN